MKYLRIFKNIIANGLKGVLRNKNTGLISTMSIIAIFLILGVLLLFVLNVDSMVKTVSDTIGKVVVYFNDDSTSEEINKMVQDLSDNTEIRKITFISKEKAMDNAIEMFGKDYSFIQMLKINPFPASLVLELKDINTADHLVEKLSGYDFVENIMYLKDEITKLVKINHFIQWGGIILITILIIACVFIINNIIKMAILSRKAEIEIMHNLGASNSYIKGPFIIEGLFYALLGALISYFVIYYAYLYLLNEFTIDLFDFLHFKLVQIEGIYMDMFVIFVCLGCGVGAIGSMLAIQKYLKVA